MNAVGPTSKEIVALIRKRLSDAGITQRQAAEKTGISLATLNRRLTGQSPFFIYELVPIAA
ncbi:MAG: winged helix-turn-helix domain-containing protein, partial [Candidatus Planktophila sp.]|nr:winged helix-turn-helix domain-containing protein [Candidatus Planktophila sp.]